MYESVNSRKQIMNANSPYNRHQPPMKELNMQNSRLTMKYSIAPRAWIALMGFLVLTVPGELKAQFTFTTNNGAITITGYTGSGGNVDIPASINGYPVIAIGDYAFASSG